MGQKSSKQFQTISIIKLKEILRKLPRTNDSIKFLETIPQSTNYTLRNGVVKGVYAARFLSNLTLKQHCAIKGLDDRCIIVLTSEQTMLFTKILYDNKKINAEGIKIYESYMKQNKPSNVTSRKNNIRSCC